MNIKPKDFIEDPKAVKLTVDKDTETSLIAKAKELLTKPMSEDRLIDVLEHWCVYGRTLVGKVDGSYTVADGHESKHYTSKQLSEIIKQVRADLAPPAPEPEVIE